MHVHSPGSAVVRHARALAELGWVERLDGVAALSEAAVAAASCRISGIGDRFCGAREVAIC